MKTKINNRQIIAALALSLALFASCNKNKNNEPQSPEDSRQIIEDTTLDAIQTIDANDFAPAVKTLSEVSEALDASDTGTLVQWASGLIEKMSEMVETAVDTVDGVVLHSIDVKALYTLAPFTGRFTLGSAGTWTREEENYLTFVVPVEGGTVTINLTVSDKVSTVKVATWKDYIADEWTEDYQGKDAEGNPVYTTVTNRQVQNGYINADVPETMNLSFLLNGEEVCVFGLTASLNTPSAIVHNDELDVDAAIAATGSITQGVKVGAYSFDITKFGVDGSKAFLAAEYTKDKARVLQGEFTLNCYHVDTSTGEAGVESIFVDADMLGKVQVMGSIQYDKLYALLASVDDLSGDEYQGYEYNLALCEQINSYVDIGLFFGSGTRQASLAFYPTEFHDEISGTCYYEIIPVIDFTKGEGTDGGRFAIADYFNEKDFSEVIKAWDDLLQSFAELLPAE